MLLNAGWRTLIGITWRGIGHIFMVMSDASYYCITFHDCPLYMNVVVCFADNTGKKNILFAPKVNLRAIMIARLVEKVERELRRVGTIRLQ